MAHLSKKAVIIRQKLNHNGHSLNCKEEKHHSRPDPRLLMYIDTLLDQRKKPMEILCMSWQFARDQGQFDVNDRRYFLSPADINNICQKYKINKRIHQNDAVAVHELCTQVLKDEIILYQDLQEGVHPLIIVYQNKEQRERMKKLAPKVVFLDATYKGLTAYGYTFYALVARNEQGRGTPLSYCISSDDTSDVVKLFLKSLRTSAESNGFIFGPRSFMVDRDTKEISAINEVFPNSSVLLCWFHVLQAIYRFLKKKESGISGSQHAQSRKNVVDYIRSMKICTKKEDFSAKVRLLPDQMPTPVITKYLLENWCNEKWGPLWSNYGRHFYHDDHDTNNLVERFFLSMKYHFLGGYANHRIEDLLLLLHGNVANFYNYLEELAMNGRLKRSKYINEKGKQAADTMLKAGLDKKVQWISKTECMVPSQTVEETFYDVDIINVICNCPASTQKGMCKHIHLAQAIAALRNIDISAERFSQAEKVYQESRYFHDKENHQLEILSDSGLVSVVNLNTNSCSCFANSHGIRCTCLIVSEMIFPQSENARCVANDMEAEVESKSDESTEILIKRKIQEINVFISSDKFCSVTEKKKKLILQALSKAYIICNLNSFSKKTRKRKVQPLFPNRKSKIKKSDHNYQSTTKHVLKRSGPQLNEDGSFKTTNRNKGCIRKPFQ